MARTTQHQGRDLDPAPEAEDREMWAQVGLRTGQGGKGTPTWHGGGKRQPLGLEGWGGWTGNSGSGQGGGASPRPCGGQAVRPGVGRDHGNPQASDLRSLLKAHLGFDNLYLFCSVDVVVPIFVDSGLAPFLENSLHWPPLLHPCLLVLPSVSGPLTCSGPTPRAACMQSPRVSSS